MGRGPRGSAPEKRLRGRVQNRTAGWNNQISRRNRPSSVLRARRGCRDSPYQRRCDRRQARRESIARERRKETASDWFWETGPDYKFTLLSENAFGSRPADRIGTAGWEPPVEPGTEAEQWRR